MSKINHNLLKAKIELIAKNPKNKNNMKQKELNISSKTLKDSYSNLEECKENFNEDFNIKKEENNYNKNNINMIRDNNSSIITKESSKYINNIRDYSKIIKELNLEEMNELKEIYNDLFILFNDICFKSETEKESKKTSIENCDIIIKLKILSNHFMKILLNENTKKIIEVFYSSIEINKFFLYQIYLILSIIYLNEEKLNEYLILSYKTVILYSLKNFENIYQFLNDFSLFGAVKINKNILIQNKIIISLLKTLTSIPSNSQIIYYISPLVNKDYYDENNEKELSGINNLLFLLKNNKDLIKKMEIIEEEEFKILKNIELLNNKILPEFDSKSFKFSVFIELDETLVHYCEEGNNYFVKIRYNTEKFLDYIKSFCEIIIVSTSGKEYSDIIIDNLNQKGNVIKHRIYIEEHNFLNLSKINRDINKCIFISHEQNFMGEPADYTILLKGFYGDEKDQSFIKLEKEFKKLETFKNEDFKNFIKESEYNINKN